MINNINTNDEAENEYDGVVLSLGAGGQACAFGAGVAARMQEDGVLDEIDSIVTASGSSIAIPYIASGQADKLRGLFNAFPGRTTYAQRIGGKLGRIASNIPRRLLDKLALSRTGHISGAGRAPEYEFDQLFGLNKIINIAEYEHGLNGAIEGMQQSTKDCYIQVFNRDTNQIELVRDDPNDAASAAAGDKRPYAERLMSTIYNNAILPTYYHRNKRSRFTQGDERANHMDAGMKGLGVQALLDQFPNKQIVMVLSWPIEKMRGSFSKVWNFAESVLCEDPVAKKALREKYQTVQSELDLLGEQVEKGRILLITPGADVKQSPFYENSEGTQKSFLAGKQQAKRKVVPFLQGKRRKSAPFVRIGREKWRPDATSPDAYDLSRPPRLDTVDRPRPHRFRRRRSDRQKDTRLSWPRSSSEGPPLGTRPTQSAE